VDDKAINRLIDLSEGNPGAMTVLVQMVEIFGENALLQVEKVEGLRGSEIWMLYKNGQKIGDFFAAVLRKAGFGNG